MQDQNNLIAALLAGDRSHAHVRVERSFVADALELATRYTRIEKKVLGSVQVTYSPASLEIGAPGTGDLLAQSEAVAEAERARMKLPSGPILELARLIEEQGIKILPRHFPSTEYMGGFFFDEKLGPCILLHAGAGESQRQYALAHQYAHFIADYDPYITTLCGAPDPGRLDDPIEMRAHAIALALLMPRSDLEIYREALDLTSEARVSFELVRQLSVYFDLDPEIVFWRLLELGWINAEELSRLLAENVELVAELRSPSPDAAGATLLPDRFVRLVACAFGAGKLDLEAAARYLGTDVDGAESILGQFEYEQPAKTKRPRGNGGSRSAKRKR
jgi:Zn-dependent peptidase ImmA (M78 family)